MNKETVDKTCYVYLLKCDITLMEYVGISYSVLKRWREHSSANTLIGRSIRKYHFDNFTKDILFVGPRKDCLAFEAKYCDKYTLHPKGYNLVAGGMGPIVESDETKKNRSKAQTGRCHSEQTKIKMSISASRRKSSEQTKAAISKAMMGNTYNKGKTRTDEQRKAQSERQKGKMPKEQRADLSKRMTGANNHFYGQTHTDEAKHRMSEKKRGRPLSEKHRESLRLAWARRKSNNK